MKDLLGPHSKDIAGELLKTKIGSTEIAGDLLKVPIFLFASQEVLTNKAGFSILALSLIIRKININATTRESLVTIKDLLLNNFRIILFFLTILSTKFSYLHYFLFIVHKGQR